MRAEYTIEGSSGLFGTASFHSYDLGWGTLWYTHRITLSRGAVTLVASQAPFLHIIDYSRLRNVDGVSKPLLYVDGQFSKHLWEPYLDEAWFIETEFGPGEEMDYRLRALQGRREIVPIDPGTCVRCMSMKSGET